MQGYNDTRWSNRHAGQQAQDWFLPRAWTGPGDSKQGFPGAACGKVSAHQSPQRANRHWVCIRALLCLSWSKEQGGVVQKQGESEPQPGNASPWQDGQRNRDIAVRSYPQMLGCVPMGSHERLWEWGQGRGGGPRGEFPKGTPWAGPGTGRATWGLRRRPPWRLPTPRQPVQCSVLVGLWKWVAEQRALISSRQQDVGKNTPWKTRLRPGTKIATQFSVSAARICSGGKTHPVHSPHPGERTRILHKQGWTRRP